MHSTPRYYSKYLRADRKISSQKIRVLALDTLIAVTLLGAAVWLPAVVLVALGVLP